MVPVCQWIPRSLFGRCVALFAYVKMTLVALYVNFLALSSSRRPQVVICDQVSLITCNYIHKIKLCFIFTCMVSSFSQVSACIPALKLLPCIFYPKIMFYCHFPDQLLTTRESWLKKFYRAPLDWFEQFTTGLADKIVVNSLFTSKLGNEIRVKEPTTFMHLNKHFEFWYRIYFP